MGTGCARGFLSCMDTAWMMKRFFASDFEPMKLLEQREVLLNLLPQTTTTRLHANHAAYTIDPETRYLSAMDSARAAPSCAHLYDCGGGGGGGSSQNGPSPAAKTTTEPAKKRVKTMEMKSAWQNIFVYEFLSILFFFSSSSAFQAAKKCVYYSFKYCNNRFF